MNKPPLAIATISLIRDKDEASLVLKSLDHLNKLDVPVILVDGGSPSEYFKQMHNYKNIQIFDAKGLTREIITSIEQASRIADTIFYLHTDKIDFIDKYVAKIIDHYKTLPKDTMLVAGRNQESFNTSSTDQQMAEVYQNYFIGDYFGIKGDYSYGAKIFSSKLVPHLKKIKTDQRFGIESFLYGINKRLGFGVELFEVDIVFPKDVGTVNEVKFHRMSAVKNHIEGLMFGMKVEID